MKKYLYSQLSASGVCGNVENIKKIQGEASTRGFFRVTTAERSLVAMVYPEPEPDEICRIQGLTELYRQKGLNVPQIEAETDERILLLEDLGAVSVQAAYARFGKPERQSLLEKIALQLDRLAGIPLHHTDGVLGTARMQWEMDFFIEHFAPRFCTLPGPDGIEQLRRRLHEMVWDIGPVATFAHRDFHSRNMLYQNDEVYLVDFQDSLRAPLFYDTVSFAFDAYLDLKGLRDYFLDALKELGWEMDHRQFYLTALQRNIKALGTFGYQVTVRKNLTYKKYMNRTIGYVLQNPLFSECLAPFDKSMFVQS